MFWTTLSSEEELNTIIKNSHIKPQIIFKHSMRCGTSFLVKESLEESESDPNLEIHLLDLIANRNISDQIASIFKVRHESPQVLIIKDGICVYQKAHSGIRMQSILNATADKFS